MLISKKAFPRYENAKAPFHGCISLLTHAVCVVSQSSLDPFMIHSGRLKDFANLLNDLLEVYHNRNLKLLAKRCKQVLKRLKIFWQIIEEKENRTNPHNIETFRKVEHPSTVKDLGQFTHSCTWISSHIWDFYSYHSHSCTALKSTQFLS